MMTCVLIESGNDDGSDIVSFETSELPKPYDIIEVQGTAQDGRWLVEPSVRHWRVYQHTVSQQKPTVFIACRRAPQ